MCVADFCWSDSHSVLGGKYDRSLKSRLWLGVSFVVVVMLSIFLL
jgi:hypothetical protein